MAPMLPVGATAYVTSRASERWGREAVIVTDSREVTAELLVRLKDLLPQHHAPHDIIYLDHIQLTSSGKIIRQQI